jgi:NAD(P)-dependent dehydrogenase (short-subunit alcohol dehydrogenase family)
MRLGLTGSVGLITGATSGIGLATARSMIAEGVQVVTVSRATDGPNIGETLHVAADLFQAGEPERVIRSAESALGRVDILVNNVGHAAICTLEDLTDDDWEVAFRANLMTAIGATRAVLPGMRERHRGSIVNIASTAGRRPSLKMPAYSVTKAALLAYSRQVAVTHAGEGVRCNALIPGPTLTRSWLEPGGLAEQQGERDEVLASAAAERPLKRFADPQEIADAIVFLSSPAASHVTGAEWSVSGGSVP